MERRDGPTPPQAWAYAAGAVLVVVAVIVSGPLIAAALPAERSSTEYVTWAFAQLLTLVVVPLFAIPIVVQFAAARRLQRSPRSAAATFLLLIAVGAGLIAIPLLAAGVAAPAGLEILAPAGLVAVALLDGLAFRAAHRADTRPIAG